MIFKDKEAEKLFFDNKTSKKIPTEIQKRALTRLLKLSRIGELEDLLYPPSNHLKALGGNRLGQYSIRINDKWRICFKWQNNEAVDVEIVDYH